MKRFVDKFKFTLKSCLAWSPFPIPLIMAMPTAFLLLVLWQTGLLTASLAYVGFPVIAVAVYVLMYLFIMLIVTLLDTI